MLETWIDDDALFPAELRNHYANGSWKNITIGHYDSSTIRYELS